MVNGLTLFYLLLHKVTRSFGYILVLAVVRNFLYGALFTLIAAEFGFVMLGAPDFLGDAGAHIEHPLKIKSLLLLFFTVLIKGISGFQSGFQSGSKRARFNFLSCLKLSFL